MKVQVAPLQIGRADGAPVVYICVRVVGHHKDVEQCPDDVTTLEAAIEWSAKHWRVAASTVVVLPTEVIDALD